MSFFESLQFFLRQCLYALAAFAFVAVAAEWAIPGVVSPFLDPVPLAVGALLGLSAMALGRHDASP